VIDLPTNHSPNDEVLIPLPPAPRNRSHVPHLTSIHASPQRGPYGDERYRGNCGGFLIRDLLNYHRPDSVLDPMSGSGTCADVCRELGIPYHILDLRRGADAADPATYASVGKFDFVWMHPPYWKMITYNDDPRCLSRAGTLDEFLERMQAVIRNCRDVLTPRGRLAILIGGFSERGRYMPLAQLTMMRAIEEGLWPDCIEIIRLQYGNTSSRRSYSSSFIPGLHDTCMVFRRDG